VHQIRPTGNGRGLERQRLDQIGLGLRRRRDGGALVDLVNVVDEPDVNAALVRADEGGADDVARFVVQPDVVERELERLACAVDERRDLARDVRRGLAAVGERMNVDQGAVGYVRVSRVRSRLRPRRGRAVPGRTEAVSAGGALRRPCKG